MNILKDFRFIWVSNMTARTKYAFWIAKISSIFSEPTCGMEMLPGRNVPYKTLKKVCVIFLSIRIPRWSTLKTIFFYIRLYGKDGQHRKTHSTYRPLWKKYLNSTKLGHMKHLKASYRRTNFTYEPIGHYIKIACVFLSETTE